MRGIGGKNGVGERRVGERFDVFRKNDARKRARPFEIERVSIYLIRAASSGNVFRSRRASVKIGGTVKIGKFKKNGRQ